MVTPRRAATRVMQRLLDGHTPRELAARLAPRPPAGDPLPARVPGAGDFSADGTARRREFLTARGFDLAALPEAGDAAAKLTIENFIGFTPLPVGIIGPLRVNGLHAHGDYYIPLATTEGALVASYHRGAGVISRAGGAAALCLTESISRAPCFVFPTAAAACAFLAYALRRYPELPAIVAAQSRHCRLTEMKSALAGRELHLLFEYSTGDAAGQNMATLATDAVCRALVAEAAPAPLRWYLEANLSGDKKATALSFMTARGKRVIAEAVIPAALAKRYLRATPAALVDYWQASVVGGIQSGAIGAQGHIANALAALFIACGQDAASVAEAAVGLTRFDLDGRDLYAAVTLPNLTVGTVGGGTGLPAARACLALLGCTGEGGARAFAEICAAVALAGELSLMAALTAGDFAGAHARYGRKRQPLKP